jgi:hypothetical protein
MQEFQRRQAVSQSVRQGKAGRQVRRMAGQGSGGRHSSTAEQVGSQEFRAEKAVRQSSKEVQAGRLSQLAHRAE